jgi:hypothetical protein
MSLSFRGFRNHYRANMPLTEKLMKDIGFAFSDFFSWAKQGGKLPVVVAYPFFPSKKTTLFKISRALGMRLTNTLQKQPLLVLYFEDATHGSSAFLRSHYPSVKILNEACTDISKKKVDAAHLQVFGYNTFVDPIDFTGIAVQKSDTNALHDGRLINCPLTDKDEGSVYQLLIDNTFSDTHVVDFRVPIIGSTIPVVYKKFKRMNVRFTNQVDYAELHEPDSVFTADEQALLIAFARAMGADFCELDVLRHAGDGKMYAIDVNKTPYGPPSGLPKESTKKAVVLLTTAFQKAFLSDGC